MGDVPSLSGAMTDFLLRDVEETLWRQFKSRAALEGRTLRWVLIELIRRYVKEGLR